MTFWSIVFAVILALIALSVIKFVVLFVIEYRRERRYAAILQPIRRPYYSTRAQADKDRESALDSLARRMKENKS